MTSGQFHSFEIDSITVNREERQRRAIDPAYISELADSIRRLGLINPIVISRANELVAGECRLSACALLGWTHIPGQYTDEVDAAHLRAIELEENIKRQALPWEDECRAILEFHNLHVAEEPTWNQVSTSKALGIDPSTVTNKIQVAKELIKGNSKVLAAPRFSTAKGIVSRAESRAQEQAIESLRGGKKPSAPDDESPILTADFLEWSKTYTGPKFNFVHCDFPFGIGADKNQQGGAVETHGGYNDTEEHYWNLCSGLADFITDHAADSVHIMFWFSMHFYNNTRQFFADTCNISFDPFPLIWQKSDNIGLLPDSSRGPRRVYETAFFGSRGDRKIVSPVSNAYHGPTDRRYHMSAKPTSMLQHYFKMFVDSTTIGIDPTCGSGSSVLAAKLGGAKSFIGLEKNVEFAASARLNFNQGVNNGKVETTTGT